MNSNISKLLIPATVAAAAYSSAFAGFTPTGGSTAEPGFWMGHYNWDWNYTYGSWGDVELEKTETGVCNFSWTAEADGGGMDGDYSYDQSSEYAGWNSAWSLAYAHVEGVNTDWVVFGYARLDYVC